MTTVIGLQDEAFKVQLSALVKRYAGNRHNYIRKDSDYNETEIRTDYIDELFKALKWDINNLKGLSPLAQEVRRERGPTKGEPDYTFRLSAGETSATPVFFVEAKSPKESLDNKHHIFQAKSYAFSAAQSSLVLVVLTNFERFRLYSVDTEPSKDDDSSHGLVFDWSYEDLETKADELLLFHKDNVVNGSLSRLARHGIPITMRPPVEVPFLKRLDSFREKLARGFFNSNRSLSERDLNLLTDTILNRVVFIRFAEDRNILPPEDLRQVVRQWEYRKSETLLESLNEYFEELNRRFNGRMFANEADLSQFNISDEILSELIEDFYSPNCPYRFDQIRVELLGEIYEKYLGKVIIRRGRGVVVEEKPEVRHAKGVYYTPAYIVDEILQSCLLPKLQAKNSIEEIFELRGIDPACGSGTFLLGAYRLISSFIFSKALESEESKQRYLEEVNGIWKIKYAVKRNILEYCLNGIDIDARAIRVSELSLYLKLLEEEPDVARNPIPYLPSLDRKEMSHF